jgi:hypothetical protein
MSNYDIFLPRITITNLDTTETMKQKITDTIRNMRIGDIVLFDLFFSKKHNNHYAFITLALYDNLPATHFARTIAERGFAKLWDKDYYWKVVKYIDPDLRRPSVALNTAFIQEDDVVIDILPEKEEEALTEVADDLEERLFAEEYAGVLDDNAMDIEVFDQGLPVAEDGFEEDGLSVVEPVLSLDKYALEKLREWEDPDDDYPYEYENHDYEEERPSIFAHEDYSAFYGPQVVDVEQEMMYEPFEYAYHNLMNERTLMFPEWLHKPFPVPNCLLLKEEMPLEDDFEMFARRVLGRSLFDELCSV